MSEEKFVFLCVVFIVLATLITLWLLAKISFEGMVNPKYICRCVKGIYRPSGSMIWNEGSKYALKEKFYKCDHCGRTVSDQWPEYW